VKTDSVAQLVTELTKAHTVDDLTESLAAES
jgi:hypothetical protein